MEDCEEYDVNLDEFGEDFHVKNTRVSESQQYYWENLDQIKKYNQMSELGDEYFNPAQSFHVHNTDNNYKKCKKHGVIANKKGELSDAMKKELAQRKFAQSFEVGPNR